MISPLLVLARTWRPSQFYRGWRAASVVVLVITALSWIFFRDLAGFIGGGAWFALLFIPAIGLRKVTELTAQHRYKTARRVAAALQVVHPSAELREQVRFLRGLESGQRAEIANPHFGRQEPALRVGRTDRKGRFRKVPAVITLILLNIAAFLVEISVGNWNDFVTLHRLGALEPWRVVVLGEYWRLFTALFSARRGDSSLFQSLRALCAGAGTGESCRLTPIRDLLFDFRTRLERRRRRTLDYWPHQSGTGCGRVGVCDGNRRRLGGISDSTSARAASKGAPAQYFNHHRDSNSLRSNYAAGQHCRAYLRVSDRLYRRASHRAPKNYFAIAPHGPAYASSGSAGGKTCRRNIS